MIARVLILFVLFLAAPPACAQVPGQDAPGFQAALARWLDDDETVVPDFAALAASGNRAAQVLLAFIDARPELQGPWLAGLDRRARITLLRQPGGLSGRSWLQAASEDTPLAALWLVRLQADTPPDTVLDFARLGEDRAARDTALALAARQDPALAALATAPEYPPELRYLIWRAAPTGPALAATEIAGLPPGDPQITAFHAGPVAPADRDVWLSTAPLAAPLRALCAAVCPDTPTTCARAAYQLLPGLPGLARTGTPSETLVAPDAWDASPRGRAALLRPAAARGPDGDRLIAEITALDACTGAALARETARFRP